MMTGKKILLAVSGSIAAYKIAFLIRFLVKEKAKVKVIMTPYAHSFVSSLTLATLSKNKVCTEFYDKKSGKWVNHVKLGLWADAIIFAPLTANTLFKLAHGMCDNLACATYLSAKCPVFFAPAMDLDMYRHPSTQRNIKTLLHDGNIFIEPENGDLASGLIGIGRMAEPENILQIVRKYFEKNQHLKGKKVLITAGATHESIDSVRYIGNHSSGKMGSALANVLIEYGAEVLYIMGPSQTQPRPSPHLSIMPVETAQEMYEKAKEWYQNAHIVVFCAAVSDFAPHQKVEGKIKKESNSTWNLTLHRNPDIALELGKLKTKQFHLGFALEANEKEENAIQKMHSKNLDAIVYNSFNSHGTGFKHDTNQVKIFGVADAKPTETPLESKEKIAERIVNFIIEKTTKK